MESEEASPDSTTTTTSSRRRCHGGWWYPTMPNGGWIVTPIILSTVAWVLTIMATFSCDSIIVGVEYKFDFYENYIEGEGKLYCFNNGTCENRTTSSCYCPDGFKGYSCQYVEPPIQQQQQQQQQETLGGNLTCLNGGSLVYDEESKANKCDCNMANSTVTDIFFAGYQCEYKATSTCDFSVMSYSTNNKDPIVSWETMHYIDYDYNTAYEYETTGSHYSDCGGFHFENIPHNIEIIGLNETEMSSFESKIDQYFQTAFVYGIVSIIIGGMSIIMILIYLGCWISYSRKVVLCIMAGFMLAGSFLIAMIVKADRIYICMNDTRKNLRNGELEFKSDLYDICNTRVPNKTASEKMAIIAVLFWFAFPVWSISRQLGILNDTTNRPQEENTQPRNATETNIDRLEKLISDQQSQIGELKQQLQVQKNEHRLEMQALMGRIYEKDSEAKTAKQKLEAARRLKPEYTDEDEKPPPRPTTHKQKIHVWKKWKNDELAAGVSSNVEVTDKEIAISIVRKYNYAFQYAPEYIRADKDVVLAAVSKNAEMLKFALGGLNQDRDCWLAAGLWKEEQDTTEKGNNVNNKIVARIALSTKFSLGEDTHSSVTKFTKCLNDHPYFNDGNFKIYSPNAFSKKSCDPEWTRLNWPCRGTFETCKYDAALKTGPPQLTSCWRYSFRWHLEEAQKTKGFMIQVVDLQGQPGLYEETIFDYELGRGQQIEAEMAAAVGTKIFQIYRPRAITATGGQWLKDFRPDNIDLLASIIEKWYNGGCEDMDVFEIHCEERLGGSGSSEGP